MRLAILLQDFCIDPHAGTKFLLVESMAAWMRQAASAHGAVGPGRNVEPVGEAGCVELVRAG